MDKFDYFATAPSLTSELEQALSEVRSELLAEYLQPYPFPWILGFSGGKDSTLLAHLVFEMLLSLPKDDRRREIHIVSNDTLVESPLVISHLKQVQKALSEASEAFALPVVVATTEPEPDATFWVNLIGRGYPSPNRSFRWCTDRMKIQPTSSYIRKYVDAAGQVILLLGVRRDESAARAGSVARYDNGRRLHPHNDLPGCSIFRPIVELSTEDVWEFLGAVPPPWGGTHSHLIQLYRDALGGECPVVTAKSDAPSCGSTSSRFGCWTCTVVEKDRSLEGFIQSGWKEFGPLVEFRDWLVQIRNDPERRLAKRRNGKASLTVRGTLIPGPFTIATRQEILDRLLDVQRRVENQLISDSEIATIRHLWAADLAKHVGDLLAEGMGGERNAKA